MPDQSQMYIEYVPINELQRWPRNAKQHDIGAIDSSVHRFGYVAPVLRDETTGRLVAGHGRVDTLAQMRARGEQPPARVQVNDAGEWLVPVVRGIAFESEAEAEAYLIADNQLTILGGWDDPDLYDMLRRQAESGSLIGTGFDDDDLETLRKRLEADSSDSPLDDPQSEDTESGPLLFPIFTQEIVSERVFAHFREHGFPYRRSPLHVQMQDLNRLASCDQQRALKTHHGYMTADTYHPHRFECHAVEMRSPVDSFHDDQQLHRAIRIQFEQGKPIGETYFPMLGLVARTQACSNFRPGLAMHFYRRFGVHSGTVLDPCTGYGGRLVGWIASQLGGQYIGVDPNTETHEGNTRLAAALAPDGSVTLINAPFEDADLEFCTGQVDFVFTSPPYFAKEQYSSESTQSWRRYPTIDRWRDGFLQPLMAKIHRALKPGRYACINIADVKLRNRTFPLEDLTRAAGAAAGLQLHETVRLPFSVHMGRGLEDAEGVQAEPLFVFQKPSNRQPV